jgi:hypothetical protein
MLFKKMAKDGYDLLKGLVTFFVVIGFMCVTVLLFFLQSIGKL